MDLKVLLLCIELPFVALLIVEVTVACVSFKRRRQNENNNYDTKRNSGGTYWDEISESTNVQEVAVAEPESYVSGADPFLDCLTTSERAEFYKTFIFGSRCGLHYEVGEDNVEFFSGVFIYLSGVRYVISDGLMRKICIEYDRLRGLTAAAR